MDNQLAESDHGHLCVSDLLLSKNIYEDDIQNVPAFIFLTRQWAAVKTYSVLINTPLQNHLVHFYNLFLLILYINTSVTFLAPNRAVKGNSPAVVSFPPNMNSDPWPTFPHVY